MLFSAIAGFSAQESDSVADGACEKPALDRKREHVAALQLRLVVHAAVLEALLDHLRQRALDDAVRVDAHLAEVVLRLEGRLLEVARTEGVGVDDDRCLWLGILVLCLQRCCVHRHQHVALVAGSVDPALADVYLESGHAGQ